VRKNGNVLWIAPKDELATKEQVDLEAKKKIAELEPLRTQSFQLNYTKAEDVAKGLTGQMVGQAWHGSQANNSRILSPRGSVIFETAHQPALRHRHPVQAGRDPGMIAKIDIPVRQVLIEARIVEADDSFGRAWASSSASPTCAACAAAPGLQRGGGNYVTVGGNYSNVGVQTGQTPARPPATRPTRSSSTCRPTPAARRQRRHLRAVAVQRRRPTAS
jgi:type IV pilus assembly protein PilQ